MARYVVRRQYLMQQMSFLEGFCSPTTATHPMATYLQKKAGHLMEHMCPHSGIIAVKCGVKGYYECNTQHASEDLSEES